MRKLRKGERYALFPKTNDNILEGQESFNIKEVPNTRWLKESLVTKLNGKIELERKHKRGIREYECGIYEPKYTVRNCVRRTYNRKSGVSKHECGICERKYTVSNCVSRTYNPKRGISKHECGICEPKYTVSNCVSRTRNPKSGISKHKCGICEPKYTVSNCVSRNYNPKRGIRKHECGICEPKYAVSNCVSHTCKRVNRICSWNSVVSNPKSGIWVLKNVASKPKCRKSKHKHGIREHVSDIRNCELRKSKRILGESNDKKAQVSTKLVPSKDLVRYSFAICLVFLCLFSAYPLPFLCLLVGVSFLILSLRPLGSVNNKRISRKQPGEIGESHSRRNRNAEVCSKVVHSYPEYVLATRQVCVKYALSTDIVLKGYSTKALISALRWPYAMSILYNIAGIFKAIAHKSSTSTIQNLYYANTADWDNTLSDTYQVRPASDRHGFIPAPSGLRAPIAIGARSEHDQSAKPEMQNKGGRKVEVRQNLVRTKLKKNTVYLWSTYQKATVSIRVTYQKYTLDLLKTYQRLTKKLPTRYQEVGNKLVALYRNASDNLHAFGSLTVASLRRSGMLLSKGSAICCVFILCFCVLFSDAQAQSGRILGGEIRSAADGLNKIEPLQIGDTIPEALWNLPLQVVNHPDGKDTITLNDYRDKKLIILDFWATWCGPCIKSLHKLDHILPEFEQDLFVLPSSIEETSLVKKKFDSEKFSLMTAVEQIALRKYFPCQFLPHQVWIAENRLYITTGGEASSRENILGFLTGYTPDLKNKSDVFFKPYDFIDQYAIERNAPLITKSIVTGYIEGTGNSGRRSNDSLQTYFFLNRPVIDIIKSALKISYNEIQLQNANDMAWMINKEQDISNLFCYQLFAAATTDQKDIKRKMTADLSNAFALEMQWKSTPVNCHVLSVLDKNKPQKYDKKGYPLSSLVDMLNYVIEWKSDLPVFLDETGLDWYLPERPSNKLIDSWRENPEKLKGMLEDLGLTISIQKREIAMLIVSAAADNEELVTGTLKNSRKR